MTVSSLGCSGPLPASVFIHHVSLSVNVQLLFSIPPVLQTLSILPSHTVVLTSPSLPHTDHLCPSPAWPLQLSSYHLLPATSVCPTLFPPPSTPPCFGWRLSSLPQFSTPSMHHCGINNNEHVLIEYVKLLHLLVTTSSDVDRSVHATSIMYTYLPETGHMTCV